MIVDAHAHWGPWFFTMDTGSPALNTSLLERFGIDVQLVSATEGVVYDAPLGNAALGLDFNGACRARRRTVVLASPSGAGGPGRRCRG